MIPFSRIVQCRARILQPLGKRKDGLPLRPGMKQPATRLHGAHYPEVLNTMIADGLPADETTPLRQEGSRDWIFQSLPPPRGARPAIQHTEAKSQLVTLLAQGFGLRAVDARCVV